MTGSQVSMMSEQADKFMAWFARLESADRREAFQRWARSKDFSRKVVRRIARTVGRRTENRR